MVNFTQFKENYYKFIIKSRSFVNQAIISFRLQNQGFSGEITSKPRYE